MHQYKIKFLEDKLIDYLGSAPEAVMNHLIGTAVILKEYGAPDYLVDAGLFHSIYGEESSRNVPKNLYLSRQEIVYEFSSIPDPRSQNILSYPDGQLKKDLILLDRANEEQMNG